MKTRAQRVIFRAILVTFSIVSLFFACVWGFSARDPISMFLVIFVPGIVGGLIVAGLVVWVMKAFSEPPQQDSDDDDDEDDPPPPRAYASSRANPPQQTMKLLIYLFLISMMIVVKGCDTPNQKHVSRKTPAESIANKEIQTEQSVAKKSTLTEEEKQFIRDAWASGQLNEENWDWFLENVRNEPDSNTAVKNALDNSFKARLRRSRTKWRRQLSPPP